MNRSLAATCFVFLSSCVVVLAQQANSANATQTIAGRNGPPYPITGVPLPYNVTVPGTLTGLPNAPFTVFESPNLQSPGTIVLGNQRADLDMSMLSIVFDGTTDPAFRLDQNGQWTIPITVTPGLPIGYTTAFQSMIADPGAAQSARLTAASEIVVTQGVTILPQVLGDDTCNNVSLTPYGLSIPFYGSSYSDFFVCGNGYVTFGMPSNDFTPLPSEMLSQMPRISMFWTDLTPNLGGTVEVLVDESLPLQEIRVVYTAVPEFGNAGPPHTFMATMDVAGNVSINQDPFNSGPPGFTVLTGISPGGNMSGLTTPTDLSALGATPLTTNMNDAVFEWFGTAAAANWVGTPNPFDLSGMTVSYGFVSPGVYFVTSF